MKTWIDNGKLRERREGRLTNPHEVGVLDIFAASPM
jgi:hypothetical protein